MSVKKPFSDHLLILHELSNAPDFNVVTDSGCDLGVAWKKSKDGRDYLSVRLDGPFTQTEVNCALFSNRDGGYDLVWTRAEARNRPQA